MNDSKYYDLSEPTYAFYKGIIEEESVKLSALLNTYDIPCYPAVITYNLAVENITAPHTRMLWLILDTLRIARTNYPDSKFYALRHIYRTLGYTIAQILNNSTDAKYDGLYRELSILYPDSAFDWYQAGIKCPDMENCFECPYTKVCYPDISNPH